MNTSQHRSFKEKGLECIRVVQSLPSGVVTTAVPSTVSAVVTVSATAASAVSTTPALIATEKNDIYTTLS